MLHSNGILIKYYKLQSIKRRVRRLGDIGNILLLRENQSLKTCEWHFRQETGLISIWDCPLTVCLYSRLSPTNFPITDHFLNDSALGDNSFWVSKQNFWMNQSEPLDLHVFFFIDRLWETIFTAFLDNQTWILQCIISSRIIAIRSMCDCERPLRNWAIKMSEINFLSPSFRDSHFFCSLRLRQSCWERRHDYCSLLWDLTEDSESFPALLSPIRRLFASSATIHSANYLLSIRASQRRFFVWETFTSATHFNSSPAPPRWIGAWLNFCRHLSSHDPEDKQMSRSKMCEELRMMTLLKTRQLKSHKFIGCR